MSDRAKAGAVIYAKRVSDMRAFYAGAIGLDVMHAESDHVVLESPAFQLVVLAIPEPIAASIELASPPEWRTQTPIKLVFFVENIAAVRAVAPGLGGEVNVVEREWKFRQHTVCDGHDPEGNVFQLREPAV
ncbi:MAG: VOC family protein [Lysobacteraceae bacterium]